MSAAAFTRDDSIVYAAAHDAGSTEPELQKLAQLQAGHGLWKCRLLTSCRAGLLTKDDFTQIFSQYYRYSANFTRYLAALMMNCEDDYYRSRLAANLYEEGGAAEPERRHAELFRRFLREALGVEAESIRFRAFADNFFLQYLGFCRNSHPLAAAAFLSMGTEGIIPRLYGYLCDGLLQAGIAEEHLAFFRIHMKCDDEHAVTLAELVRSYSAMPGWLSVCEGATNRALEIRLQFLDEALEFALNARLRGLLDRVRGEHSLVSKQARADELVSSAASHGAKLSGLYSNRVEHLNIDFSVRRVEFDAEVFDVRLVTIPPHRNNERHRHAHESLLMVTKGAGRVVLDDFDIEVSTGDTIFVPRWAMHQTQNTGDHPMELLAVTDYGLTRRAYLGDHLRTTRMNAERDADSTAGAHGTAHTE